MRSLLKLLMVVGMVAAFGAGAYGLSVWWAGPEKRSAVVVVLAPPSTEEGVALSRGRVVLYEGEARPPGEAEVPVDESEEINLSEATADPRFELDADPGDGTRFFVWAWLELSDFNAYCESVALPPVRFVREGKPSGWVSAETGRPLRPLRIQMNSLCPH